MSLSHRESIEEVKAEAARLTLKRIQEDKEEKERAAAEDAKAVETTKEKK